MKNSQCTLTKNNGMIFLTVENQCMVYSIRSGIFAHIKDECLFSTLKEWNGNSKASLKKRIAGQKMEMEVEKLLKQLDILYAFNEKEHPKFEIEKNKPSNFWLLVTDSCNLKCSYCYHSEENKKMWNAHMSLETAQKAVDLFFSKYANQSVIVNFFGGEPLLNFPLIQKIVPYIKERSIDAGVQASLCISTNAVNVTPEITAFLKAHDFFVTVSIDGNRDQHNKTRKLINGDGSYDRVEKGVSILREQFDYLGARVTVTRENVLNLSEAFEALFNMGFDSVAYKLVGACSDNLIVPENDFPVFEQEVEKVAQVFENSLEQGTFKISDRHLQWMKKIYKKPVMNECSFAINGKLVVDPKGNLYSCQETVGNQQFLLGDIHSGIDLKKQKSCMPPLLKQREACKDCWMNEICDGMCYYSAYVKYGHFERPIKESCAEIQNSFLESLWIYAKLFVYDQEYLMKIMKSDYKCLPEIKAWYQTSALKQETKVF